MEKFKNAATLPKLYYGLHMVEGVAEYRPAGANPYRVFVSENTIKNMDPSFQGCPVYVGHVDDVNVSEIGTDKDEADGYVVRSFFNQADGKHWVEFLVTTDRGHEAIRNGWKLSNCYVSKNSKGGGQWHGVDYLKEISEAQYEHLAIVQRPRYEESVIMTPEKFKEYNEKKEFELKRIANSNSQPKEKKMGKFSFFKRERVENSADLENMMVDIKGVGQISISDALSKLEKFSNGYHCNGDERVKVGDKDMAVNELVSKHLEHEEKLLKMEMNSKAEEEKKANESKAKEEEEKAKNEKETFEKIKNAAVVAKQAAIPGVLSKDRVLVGQSKYGSGK